MKKMSKIYQARKITATKDDAKVTMMYFDWLIEFWTQGPLQVTQSSQSRGKNNAFGSQTIWVQIHPWAAHLVTLHHVWNR